MRVIERGVNSIREHDLDAEAIFACTNKMYDPAISTILMGTGAEETIPLFEKANVTMKAFLLLTDDDLKTIGVALSSTRKEIQAAVKNFHMKEWVEESLPLTRGTAISFQEALTITMNSMKQLQLLACSFKYMSDGLERDSPPVPVNKDVPVTAVLCKCIDAAIAANKQLDAEMHALKLLVNQMHPGEDDAEADYILPAPPARETKSALALLAISIGLFAAVCAATKTDFLSKLDFVRR